MEKREALKELGKFIRHHRLKNRISAYSIEQEYNISRSLWSRLENGKSTNLPKPEQLRLISEILGINCIEMYIILGYLTRKEIMDYLYGEHRNRDSRKTNFSEKP